MKKLSNLLPKKLEKHIQNEILELLSWAPGYYWRNNSGVANYEGKNETSQRKSNRYVHFGLVGSADIIGVGPGGVFVAIECKRPGQKLSEAQKNFKSAILKHGGIFIEARSLDDVIKGLPWLTNLSS